MLAYLAFEGAGYDIVVRQGVALGIWSAIALGLAFGVLPRGRLDRRLLVPAVAALALLLWMLLSLGWTSSDERTVAEIARVLGYAGLMALALLALNKHTSTAAAAGLSTAAFAVAGVAVLSRLAPSLFPDALAVAGNFTRSDRLTFPLDYWNAVGAWGAMCVAVGVAWSAHARTAAARVLLLAAVPVAGVAVYLSYSRGGVIAAAVAIVAAVALSRNRWTAFLHALAALAGTALVTLVTRGQTEIADATGNAGAGAVAAALLGAALLGAGAVLVTTVLHADQARLPRRVANWAVPMFVLLVLGAIAVGGHGPISDAWHEFRTQDQAVATGPEDPAARLTNASNNRDDYWASAINAFEAHPLQGIGSGTFEFWWESDAVNPEYVKDAHSLYAEQLAELGLPGLLLLLAGLGGSLGVALTARRTLPAAEDVAANVAMCSAFVVFAFTAGIDWMWEETAVAAFALGGIAIAAASASPRLRKTERRGPLGRPGVRTGLVAAAVLAAAFQVPGLVSNDRVRASEEQLAAGKIEEARASAEAAIDAEPWAATPRQQLATVEQTAGNLDAARARIEEAIEREPTNWRWPLVLAPIEAQLGTRDAADETFREGRELAPLLPFYSPFSYYGLQVYTRPQLKRIYARQQQRESAEPEPSE